MSARGRGSFVACLVVAVAYASVGLWLAGRGATPFSGDQGLKFLQVAGLAEGHAWLPPEAVAGECVDSFPPLRPPFVYSDGDRWYSVYLNPLAYAAAWLERGLGPASHLLVPLASVLGLLAVAIGMARRVGADVATSYRVAILLLVASPLWFYGWTFWEHAPATLFCTAALSVLLVSPLAPSVARIAAAGLLLGVAGAFRQESLVFAVAAALATAVASRRAFLAAGLVAIAVLTDAAIMRALPGLPSSQHLAWLTDLVLRDPTRFGLRATLLDRWEIVRELLVGAQRPLVEPDVAAISLAALSGVAALVLLALSGSASRAGRALVTLATALAVFVPAACAAIDGRTQVKGLFSACPILIVFVPLAVSRLRSLWPTRTRPLDASRARHFVLAAASIAFLALGLASAPNDGGNEWGPRFLLPLLPALFCLGFASRDDGTSANQRVDESGAVALLGGRRLAGPLLIALLVASVAIQVIGARNFLAELAAKRAALSRLAALPGRYVVTSAWFLPQEGALLSVRADKRFLLVQSGEELGAAIGCIARQGESALTYVAFESGRDDDRDLALGEFRPRESYPLYLHPFELRVSSYAR